MRFALRPYIVAGAAIVGASVIVLAPASPPLPTIEVPAVLPAGSELSGFNQQDTLGMLANIEGLGVLPDYEALNLPAQSPGLGPLPNPVLPPPNLGSLDLGGLDLRDLGPANPSAP